MLDFSDHLKKGKDLTLITDTRYKVRNLLKTSVGENPYASFLGVDLSRFLTGQFSLNALKSKISQYLTIYQSDVKTFDVDLNAKGQLAINLKVQESESTIGVEYE